MKKIITALLALIYVIALCVLIKYPYINSNVRGLSVLFILVTAIVYAVDESCAVKTVRTDKDSILKPVFNIIEAVESLTVKPSKFYLWRINYKLDEADTLLCELDFTDTEFEKKLTHRLRAARQKLKSFY